ncbi:strigolactone esterase D14-like [Phoenix dactylifera]|uniref:Strigolactone esterase D14-like n=1 Tax=Phoenix dactylifera TaxID=42345 RepID=A0A8B7BEZ7_PHODC|nr:strigolactone esterase D14-like [Phoenix dactylifera]
MHRNARIVGNGEQTVVLSHGYGGSQSVWDNVVSRLTQRYQVLLFDWNFSGATDEYSGKPLELSKYSSFTAFADDLISLIDETNLDGVIFIGHSMSGMIGCIASVKRPDLFSHLVLIGASPRYLNSEGYEGGFERMEVEKMFVAIESNFQSWAQSFVTLAIGVNDPISIETFKRSFLQMRPDIALSVAKMIFLSDLRDVLGKVEVPCTIIQGTNDIVVPTSVARYIQHKMKGKAMVEIIRFDGHFPQLTAHQMLMEALDRVLAAVEVQKDGKVSSQEYVVNSGVLG